MKILILGLLAVLAVSPLASGQTTNLYIQTFEYDQSGTGNQPLSQVGWSNAVPDAFPNFIYFFNDSRIYAYQAPATPPLTISYYTETGFGSGSIGTNEFLNINPAPYNSVTLSVAASPGGSADTMTVRFLRIRVLLSPRRFTLPQSFLRTPERRQRIFLASTRHFTPA